MTASAGQIVSRPGPTLRARFRKVVPYLLLAPGLLWLTLFYVVPAIQMFTYSISTGSIEDGYTIDLSGHAYITALTDFSKQFINSILYGGIATLLTLVIGFPVAYTIAFKGGRYKNLILFLVIAPFFTSFLIRTISWKILLGDEGPIFGFLKHGLGILPGTALPHQVPRHPECGAADEPVDDTVDGNASVTVVYTGCPGGVTVERVVQVAGNRLLWVQVRSADRATANAVLDDVRTHGI